MANTGAIVNLVHVGIVDGDLGTLGEARIVNVSEVHDCVEATPSKEVGARRFQANLSSRNDVLKGVSVESVFDAPTNLIEVFMLPGHPCNGNGTRCVSLDTLLTIMEFVRPYLGKTQMEASRFRQPVMRMVLYCGDEVIASYYPWVIDAMESIQDVVPLHDPSRLRFASSHALRKHFRRARGEITHLTSWRLKDEIPIVAIQYPPTLKLIIYTEPWVKRVVVRSSEQMLHETARTALCRDPFNMLIASHEQVVFRCLGTKELRVPAPGFTGVSKLVMWRVFHMDPSGNRGDLAMISSATISFFAFERVSGSGDYFRSGVLAEMDLPGRKNLPEELVYFYPFTHSKEAFAPNTYRDGAPGCVNFMRTDGMSLTVIMPECGDYLVQLVNPTVNICRTQDGQFMRKYGKGLYHTESSPL